MYTIELPERMSVRKVSELYREVSAIQVQVVVMGFIDATYTAFKVVCHLQPAIAMPNLLASPQWFVQLHFLTCGLPLPKARGGGHQSCREHREA